MKVLAFYLPQYHEIEENNIWWGKGYTEWEAVKNAKKYYKGHEQPRVPLNNNYYDLNVDGKKTWEWQSKLAKENGVYGFCIYHYWFTGKKLLEKPMEILLKNKDIDIHYSICWANETWSRNWDGQFDKVLIKQEYGDENDWVNHFNYLLPFFQDQRYIKINNCPVVHIYKGSEFKELPLMKECWNKLAKKSGFNEVYFIGAKTPSSIDLRNDIYKAYYYFEPGYTLKRDYGLIHRIFYLFISYVKMILNIITGHHFVEHIANAKVVWKKIENRKYKSNEFPGTFVSWDNTPRRKNKGTIFKKTSPSNFHKHLKKLKKNINANPYFIYINAWNEWGEGAYLEPDILNKYGYINAIKNVFLEQGGKNGKRKS